MTPPASTRARGVLHLGDIAAAVSTIAWLLVVRSLLHTPWSLAATPESGGLLNAGFVCNPGDSWSYLSWVQQYRGGAGLAGLLYTTDPHPPLLWIFPLWLVGRLAALTGWPAIGVYNLAGLFAAGVATFLVRRAARALGGNTAVVNWTTVGFVFGSGGSWLWHLVHKAGWAPAANGGDLFFLDLFPATAFVAYAYHAMSFALLAGLWWCTLETERRFVAAQPAVRWFAATVLLALLLGFSRPYEPLAFLGAWGLKTLWHLCTWRTEPAFARAALLIGVVLAAGLVPGIARAYWISQQPVWSTFATESLALGLGRGAWATTLAGWMLLVALGVGPVRRACGHVAVLPVAASLLMFALLLGLGSQAKLASGLLLGPILLGGWGAARIMSWFSGYDPVPRVGLVAVTAVALFGGPSLFMALRAMHLNGPARIDPELPAIARSLARADGTPATVLTDLDTGTILPGLVGARVWAGHFSLTPRFRERRDTLRAAGLDPQHPAPPSAALDALAQAESFHAALIDLRCVAAAVRLQQLGWTETARTERWAVLRPPSHRDRSRSKFRARK